MHHPPVPGYTPVYGYPYLYTCNATGERAQLRPSRQADQRPFTRLCPDSGTPQPTPPASSSMQNGYQQPFYRQQVGYQANVASPYQFGPNNFYQAPIVQHQHYHPAPLPPWQQQQQPLLQTQHIPQQVGYAEGPPAMPAPAQSAFSQMPIMDTNHYEQQYTASIQHPGAIQIDEAINLIEDSFSDEALSLIEDNYSTEDFLAWLQEQGESKGIQASEDIQPPDDVQRRCEED